MTPSFIDTNILISYCNPFDRFHVQAVEFINSRCPTPIYLITTIREEFMKRVQDSVYNLLDRINYRGLRLTQGLQFNRFMQRLRRELRGEGFLELIISHFNDYIATSHTNNITYSMISRFLTEFPNSLINCIKNLTGSWIEIPNDLNLYHRFQFRNYENYIRNYIHYPDVTHICIGIHESQMRNNQRINYTFYTNDHSWQHIPLGSYRNFNIELTNFR
jgi:hypothetical protein